jgi:hypothetical protein
MQYRLIAALLVAWTGSAHADRVKVAIVAGTSANLDTTRVDALAQDLADALRAELDIDTVAGLEVRRQLADHEPPPDCVADQACITEVATRLGAQQLLFVVIAGTGTSGAIQIDTTWIDPASNERSARPVIVLPERGDVRSRLAFAAKQLLPSAPVRATPEASVSRMSPAVPRHLTRPSYLTAGAAAVGVGVGVSLGLVARGRYQDCEERAATGGCSSSRKDAIRRVALVADAGWLLAIGGTIATAVLYATSGEAPHVIVEPAAGGVAVTAIGRF